jgi:hypothetical protein
MGWESWVRFVKRETGNGKRERNLPTGLKNREAGRRQKERKRERRCAPLYSIPTFPVSRLSFSASSVRIPWHFRAATADQEIEVGA